MGILVFITAATPCRQVYQLKKVDISTLGDVSKIIDDLIPASVLFIFIPGFHFEHRDS
jgi:hypothetical protein